MKGQSLAVETVFTVGMGIAIATGTITLFDDYRTKVKEESTNKKGEIILSRVESKLYTLEASRYGIAELSLPDELSSTSYTVSFNGDKLEASNSDAEFSTKLNGISDRYVLEGSAQGGEISIQKKPNRILLRGG